MSLIGRLARKTLVEPNVFVTSKGRDAKEKFIKHSVKKAQQNKQAITPLLAKFKQNMQFGGVSATECEKHIIVLAKYGWSLENAIEVADSLSYDSFMLVVSGIPQKTLQKALLWVRSVIVV